MNHNCCLQDSFSLSSLGLLWQVERAQGPRGTVARGTVARGQIRLD